MISKNKDIKNLYDIFPVGATAKLAIEEGNVEAIIDGYMFEFTIQEYSNGILKVLLDSDSKKARKILKSYGASFEKETMDEIQGEEFKKRIGKYTESQIQTEE
jgi:hypothetical protein